MCDVIPDGMDMVGWLGVGFIVILLTGFYLWYWPGVKRWANALRIQRGRGRFTFNMSLHKVIGFLVWIPLTVIAFTGIVFAFPNIEQWYENVTPAAARLRPLGAGRRLGVHVGEAAGREPDRGRRVPARSSRSEYPNRTIDYIGVPHDKEGSTRPGSTRGFDPWTREGGGGNTYVFVDQYTGEIVYDGPPEDGNVFDQALGRLGLPVAHRRLRRADHARRVGRRRASRRSCSASPGSR